MSDKQIPVTVSIDEAASRRRMEEQLNRLAQEIGSKATVTLGFRLDDGAIAAQSQRLTSAVQQSLDRTNLKVSNLSVDESGKKSFTSQISAWISEASRLPKNYKDLTNLNDSVGRRTMPTVSRR